MRGASRTIALVCIASVGLDQPASRIETNKRVRQFSERLAQRYIETNRDDEALDEIRDAEVAARAIPDRAALARLSIMRGILAVRAKDSETVRVSMRDAAGHVGKADDTSTLEALVFALVPYTGGSGEAPTDIFIQLGYETFNGHLGPSTGATRAFAVLRGQRLLAQGDKNEAIDVLTAAANGVTVESISNPTNYAVLVARARALAANGDSNGATAALVSLLQNSTGLAAEQRARLVREAEQCATILVESLGAPAPGALTDAIRAVGPNGNWSSAFWSTFGLAKTMLSVAFKERPYDQHKVNAGRDLLLQARSLLDSERKQNEPDDRDTIVLTSLASLYSGTKQHDLALNTIEEAIRHCRKVDHHRGVDEVFGLSGNTAEAMRLRGQILADAGRYHESVVAYREVLQVDDDHHNAALGASTRAETKMRLAYVLHQLGRGDQAREEARNALAAVRECFPANLDDGGSVGRSQLEAVFVVILCEQGMTEEAIKALGEATAAYAAAGKPLPSLLEELRHVVTDAEWVQKGVKDWKARTRQ